MRTLYISDLDGTLFNRNKEISETTEEILNQCIEKGMLFSVATARMPYGCDYRLEKVKMNIPGIVTNGVFLYDFKNKRYLSGEAVETETVKQVIKAFKENGLSCFVYTYQSGSLSIYYDSREMTEQTQYYSERALECCREVCLVEDYERVYEKGDICYFACTGEKNSLEPVCRRLEEISGVSYSCYLNIYNGKYCLEVFSRRANKRNALLRLKKMLNCSQVVVFGDNYNDLPMIEAADRSYVPANGLEEIKERADGVLEDCDRDGVARFLAKEILGQD